jgi:hypothetical protein
MDLSKNNTSYCVNLLAKFNDNHFETRIKIYNKTIHPLFAPERVFKTMGIGTKPFLLGSMFFSENDETKQRNRADED